MHPVAETYRDLLTRVDRWFHATVERHPGVVPCRSGCTACCHGPFDISAADTLLLREGLATLAPADRAAVAERGARLLGRMREIAPDWGPPWDLRILGEETFDRISEALADEPCPMLDRDGACLVYAFRPLVCRLMGLPMLTAEGELLENACPIQERFPDYLVLDPQLFDLDSLEAAEVACQEGAAGELLGNPTAADFETTIAACVVPSSSPAPSSSD
jgi:Fe-S-cluster containining protein